MKCLCGKEYDTNCRLETFSQITGAKYLDTSLLTNNVKKNRELLRNPNNFYTMPIRHGPVKREDIYYNSPPQNGIIEPSAPSLDLM